MLGIELGGEIEGAFEVLPENWETVTAFLLVQSQWRTDNGVMAGLDYMSCKAALKAAGIQFKKVFYGLRTMEFEVLSAQSQ